MPRDKDKEREDDLEFLKRHLGIKDEEPEEPPVEEEEEPEEEPRGLFDRFRRRIDERHDRLDDPAAAEDPAEKLREIARRRRAGEEIDIDSRRELLNLVVDAVKGLNAQRTSLLAQRQRDEELESDDPSQV